MTGPAEGGPHVDEPVSPDAEMTDLLGELERSIRRARDGGRAVTSVPATSPMVQRSTAVEYRAHGTTPSGHEAVEYHGYAERRARTVAEQMERERYTDVQVQTRTITTVTTRTPWEQHR